MKHTSVKKIFLSLLIICSLSSSQATAGTGTALALGGAELLDTIVRISRYQIMTSKNESEIKNLAYATIGTSGLTALAKMVDAPTIGSLKLVPNAVDVANAIAVISNAKKIAKNNKKRKKIKDKKLLWLLGSERCALMFSILLGASQSKLLYGISLCPWFLSHILCLIRQIEEYRYLKKLTKKPSGNYDDGYEEDEDYCCEDSEDDEDLDLDDLGIELEDGDYDDEEYL